MAGEHDDTLVAGLLLKRLLPLRLLLRLLPLRLLPGLLLMMDLKLDLLRPMLPSLALRWRERPKRGPQYACGLGQVPAPLATSTRQA